MDDASGFGLINAEAAVAAAIATRGKYTEDIAGRSLKIVTNNLDRHAGLRLVNQLQGIDESFAQVSVPEPGVLFIIVTGCVLLHGRPSRRMGAAR